MEITLTVTGTRPMLLHNRRLADPTNEWTRQLKQLTGKRKKTDDDLIDIMRVEARGGIYETTDGLLGLPSENLWRSIYDAATAFKMGADVKRAISTSPDQMELLLVGGEQVKVETFLQNPENVDYRSVKVMGKRTMRARPKVTDWSSTHTFDLLEDVIDPRDLVKVFERAGRLVGLGDWRPIWGTYSVEVTQ